MKVSEYWQKFKSIISKNEIAILPGHLAFYFVMSIIPIITLTFYILTSFNLSYDMINDFINNTLSTKTANLIQPIFQSGNDASFLVTLFVSFIMASNGADSIIVASNAVFNTPNSSFVKRRLKAFVITIFLILILMFIIIVPLLGSTILNLLSSFKLFANDALLVKVIYYVLQIPISFLVMYFFIKIVYTIAPDEKVQSRNVTRGALFTSACWLLVTFGYSYYINNVASYDKFYGGLASIIILMFWFYLLAYIFVVGLVLNHKAVEKQALESNTETLTEIREKVQREKLDNMKKKK